MAGVNGTGCEQKPNGPPFPTGGAGAYARRWMLLGRELLGVNARRWGRILAVNEWPGRERLGVSARMAMNSAGCARKGMEWVSMRGSERRHVRREP